MPKKPYHKEFRFKVRNGIYYVLYKTRPDQLRSTGQRTESDAIAWAYANMNTKPSPQITLRTFAQDFFIPGKCPWSTRMLKKGRTFNAYYFDGHRSRLNRYILPEFGPFVLSAISTKMIDEWLMSLKSVRNGQPLAAQSKAKIIVALRRIFAEAEYQGIIDSNPAEKVEPFVDKSQGRQPFTVDELRTLFPENIDELLGIWQSLSWATFFYIMATCGLRPSEAAALMWGDWNRSLHGAVIQRSVENKTGKMKGLKTDKHGVTMKAAMFTDRAENLLLMLEAQSERTNRDDLIFHRGDGQPHITETILKHFKASCDRAEINRGSRTTYSLRHSFNTHMAKLTTLNQVQDAMGHITLSSSKQYYHPTPEALLEKAASIRDLVAEVYG